MKQEPDTVERMRRVKVKRCEAQTKPVWYSPDGHRCEYAAVVQLDGDWLCQMHANLWVRNQAIGQEGE